MSNIARDWLTGPRNYLEGLAILENTGGTGEALLSLLRSGETVFTRKKLQSAIETLAKSAEVDTLPIEPVERKQMITPYDPLKLPPELKDVHILKGQYYKEAGKLRASLFELKTAAERRPICLKIIELKKKHAAAWEQINFYLNTGHIMPQKQSDPLPDLENMRVRELVDFIKNNPTRISKWRAKLKNETDKEARVELQRLIDIHKSLQVKANEIIDSID
ncbi:hypothetical protein QQ054_32110 [Oscillatoria amoena NRMC-F 0135]|nr:hypothetical protein [Oscillatoria amoena NRMC-F 0135]